MQLHRLEMTAFGPFAETVTVDFDRLSEASVFLLCGDTGAGKTTVLDGVCFALYGDVPSARATAKQLRSHHAPDGVAPRVVLEMTVGGRRFRFTRSPAWQRPKRRGTGTTTEPAHALVEERDGDCWVLRSNRLDEAGQLVGDLLGMTIGQFSQVVLLPQGQFDRFLRSSSEDRQQVLTRLFQTGRFEQVERWFTDRRRQLWRDNRQHNGVVAGVVHRLSEASGVPAPDGWDTDDLTDAVSAGEVRAWTDELLDAARRQRAARRTDLERAARVRDTAAHELAAGRRLAELLARRARAEAARSALDAEAPTAEADRLRLADARRAAGVEPLAQVALEAERTRAAASERTTAATLALARALDTEPEDLATEDLATREQETADRLAAARAFLPRAEELREAECTGSAALRECDRLTAGLEHSRELLLALPERRSSLLTELTEVRREAERVVVRQAARDRLEEQLTAATAVASATEELSRARAAESAQVEAAQGLRERWLALREQRLEGMAAELASAMVVGQQCPVCGSADHPSPAHPADDAPSRDDEQAALRESEDAQVALEAHRDRVRGLQSRIDASRDRAGDRGVDGLVAELARVRSSIEEGQRAAARIPDLEAALAGLDHDITELGVRVARDEQALVAARGRAEAAAVTVQRLSDAMAALLTGDAGRLEEVIAGHERIRELLATAREAVVEESRCRDQAEAADRRLRKAALAAGFPELATARAAHLADDELHRLEESVADRTRREQQAATVLADPEVAQAAGQPCPDLEGLTRVHEEADRKHTAAAAAWRLAEGVHARLQERSGELDEALARWAPLRAEYAAVRCLAELVEGKGADNTRQMRLSAYVVASRLGQVVAAANERLSRMTDGRYVLEHSDLRGAGERRGGLSLVVADQWTDERRDPVTLSGGETFVVSLALALGLADVVTAESGGTRIDTLFVDEGFGSLDADTLEQVMDTLDQLRAGGRVVGVVSHVADMRDRIPTQLRVAKGRAGSSLVHVC
jgi:exonuclease SbcC